MSTAVTMNISPDLKLAAGVSNLGVDSMKETSRLMSENHNHHVFFNEMGFHDHLAHQMLTMFAIGATPAQLKGQFDHNSFYQRPVDAGRKSSTAASSSVDTLEGFMANLGQKGAYVDFLAFFTAEIEAKGVTTVLDEYIFANNDRAKALLSRLNASIIHPIIHLGLSIEFGLAAMTAEALAWTAVHQDELGQLNVATDDAAASSSDPNANLLDLYHELQEHASAARTVLPFDGDFNTRTSKLMTADDGAIHKIISKYRVTEANVEARVQEAINVEAFVTLASVRRPYVPKADFFIVHSNNGTVYLPALLKALGPKKTALLLERQIRACLFDFTSTGSPAFDIEWTNEFVKDPSKQGGGIYNTWEAIFERANQVNDDGHVVKALRALKGAEVAAGKQSTFREPLKSGEFLGLAGMLLRSLENEPDFVAAKGVTNQWVRRAGFAEAWNAFKKVE